jgi:para-aminobenzoate synthetase/4-amino-4-deoxychorismate lyase
LEQFLARVAGDPFALLDDADGVWLLDDLRDTIEANGPDEIGPACARAESAASGAHVAVLLDYELGYWLEPASATQSVRLERPPLQALVFGRATWLERADFENQLTAWTSGLPEESRHAGIADLRHGLSADEYGGAIERILDLIRTGEIYQVNFTWPMAFRSYGEPLALYAALQSRQPVTHGAFLQLPDRHVLSLSPELFVSRQGSTLTSKPMKGTAPRGRDAAEDQALAEALRNSEKDRAENVMIVDVIRNDMGRLARPGSVRVDALFAIEAYPTVHQMVSTVSADIGEASLHDVLRALFPCASITGAPKIRAMQIAQELELGPRELYTGSIGHIHPGGDFDLNVAIRTIELDAQGDGRLGIGGGITIDSQPEAEYRECLDKARFLTGLPVGYQLIETLRLESGRYPLLEGHLGRLTASAAALGFRCDPLAIREALRRRAADLADQGVHRIRLTLAQNGDCEISHAALAPLPELPGVTVAQSRVDSGNPLLRHKTTVRRRFTDALAEAARIPGCFDALFFNERGELTEGARSSVYLVHGGRWRTPALECGLLDGVMRRTLLESHEPPIEEARLTQADLLEADEVWLSNAVHGLFRVRLLG